MPIDPASLALAVAFATAQETFARDANPHVYERDTPADVRELGAPRYRDRQAALSYLLTVRTDRLDLILRGTLSSNPEIRTRANQALNAVCRCPTCKGAGRCSDLSRYYHGTSCLCSGLCDNLGRCKTCGGSGDVRYELGPPDYAMVGDTWMDCAEPVHRELFPEPKPEPEPEKRP